jgi:hypothetical protein
MRFDIRLPIGLLFGAIGGVLVWFGANSDPALYRDHSLGLNINLIWGAAMAAFGVAMLLLVLMRRKAPSED